MSSVQYNERNKCNSLASTKVQTMRAIIKEKAATGLTMVTNQAVPEPGPGEVRLKVSAAGICGTDVHIYDWDAWSAGRILPPCVIGHEFVGIVDKLGEDVRAVKTGQRMSAEGHITCGTCYFCRTGQAHICKDVRIIGVDQDGAFADYIVMPAENLWPVPDAIPDHFAAIFDPLGNAMHTVMAQQVSGKSVLVMGAGAIGLMAIAIAKFAGASKILAVEPNSEKRNLADQVGADLCLDPSQDDVLAILRRETDELGPEIVLEMSGHPRGIRQAFEAIRSGGEMALLGIPAEKVRLDLPNDIIFKGITIRGINGRRMYTTWYQCQEFLLKNQKQIEPLITHELPLEAFQQAFDLLHQGQACKVVLKT